jgi:hypothetical protein
MSALSTVTALTILAGVFFGIVFNEPTRAAKKLNPTAESETILLHSGQAASAIT